MEVDDEEEQPQQQQQQRQPPAPPSRFDRYLARLLADELESFKFGETIPSSGRFSQWSVPQALSVSNALMASKVIESLSIPLQVCPPEALGLFEKCIQKIKSLKHIKLGWDIEHASTDLWEAYANQFDSLLGAALRNPSIESLDIPWIGSPEPIFDLLSKTRSLKKLVLSTVDEDDREAEEALSVAKGFRKNSTLKEVTLDCGASSDILGQLISGLDCHALLEELKIRHCFHSTSYLRRAMTNLIHFSSSLKRLEFEIFEDRFEEVLMIVLQPGAVLKELHLDGVCIDLDNLEGVEVAASSKVNKILESLTLIGVTFAGPNDVKIFRPLTGLRMLNMQHVHHSFSRERDEANGSTNDCTAAWKEFIEHNPKLEKVWTRGADSECVNGIWEGACELQSLKSLEHQDNRGGSIDSSRGALLRRVFEKTTSLEHLCLGGFKLQIDGAKQVAPGIAKNDTLESLDLSSLAHMAPKASNSIVGSLLVNKKLERLRLGQEVPERAGNDVDFHPTLLSVVRVNATVLSLHFPRRTVFDATETREFFAGFGPNCQLRTLSFSGCQMDLAAFVALGQCLERGRNVVDNVTLPRIGGGESNNDVKTSLQTFIASLSRIKRRFKVKFENKMDRELLLLLLQTVTENKNVLVELSHDTDRGDTADSDVLANIKLRVKLNRFTSLPRSLWLPILARMAASEDTDALFCFFREYFSAGNPCQASPRGVSEEGARPSKRARHGARDE